MIEFLISNVIQLEKTSQKLMILAEQIQMMLARSSPSDPQIVALKSIEEYQKAAHLIVGTPVVAWGSPVQ